jgi:hypothetical protein
MAKANCVTISPALTPDAASRSTGSMRVAAPLETVAVAPSAIRQTAKSP